jgi:hypothetical protein
MNANKATTRILPDVRLILAMLWVSEVLSSLNGDTYRFHDSAVLKALLANTGSIVVTPELLLIMSLLFVGSVFMSVLTLTLKSPASRWANRVIGLFYAIVNLVFWVLTLVSLSAGQVGIYEIVWYTAQLVCTLLIVGYAWTWPNDPFRTPLSEPAILSSRPL